MKGRKRDSKDVRKRNRVNKNEKKKKKEKKRDSKDVRNRDRGS